MMMALVAALVGLAALVWGADRLISGSAALARRLGASPFIIGVTLVGFGTSAPELAVSALAAWQDKIGLAVGNAVGSNIANIGMVLACGALIAPLTVSSRVLRRELPVLLLVTAGAWMLLADGMLSRTDGLVLLVAMAALIGLAVAVVRTTEAGDPMASEWATGIPQTGSPGRAAVGALIGLTGVLVGAQLLVWGAVETATALGVSDLAIGLSVVAIGTSLPELAAAIAGALKRHHAIALGNIIGSNMFNILAVLGLAGIIGPAALEEVVLHRDLPVMAGFTIAMFAMAYGFGGPGRVTRLEGAGLLAAFGVYQFLLFYTA